MKRQQEEKQTANSSLEIEFFGVRGSLASPGASMVNVGGNTSCVQVRAGQKHIVFDAGTGLRKIGQSLVGQDSSDTTILLSHLHWDHIQGFPFFSPLYKRGHKVQVLSGPNGHMSLAQALKRQMSPPFFPVDIADIAPQLLVRDLLPVDDFYLGEVRIRCVRLNHPDPVYGYRLDYRGSSVVYATDTEHFACVDPTLARLCQGADLLIYDAQYTPDEYAKDKTGWGHSTYAAAATLARAAGVGKLVLFHHAPDREDHQVLDLERKCQLQFPMTVAAREGLVIRLGCKLEEAKRAA